jgi:hypothetical protein
MSLTGKPITQITEADLLALIADKEAEGKTIEYKRDRVGTGDGDKKKTPLRCVIFCEYGWRTHHLWHGRR